MIAIFIIIGISLLVALSSFLSSVGKLIDRRRKGIKIITKRGWLIISMNLGIIILSALQFYFNEKDLIQKDLEANKKQAIRDSILKSSYDSSLYVLKNKFDTSNINTITSVTQTLGKYGYLLDSAQNKLVKIIKDSSKTKIYVQADPTLSVCSGDGIKFNKVENGITYFELLFCSEGAGSTGFNISTTIILSDSLESKNYILFKDKIKIRNQIKIVKDAAYKQNFKLPENLYFNLMFVYITGTYTNLDGTKNYKIDDIYYFNKITKTVGMVEGLTRTRILKYISDNK